VTFLSKSSELSNKRKNIKTKHYIYNLQNAITNLFEDDLFIYIRRNKGYFFTNRWI